MSRSSIITVVVNAFLVGLFIYLGIGPQKLWRKVIGLSGEISWTWLILNILILNLVVVLVVTSISMNMRSAVPRLDLTQGPLGEPTQKATLNVFKMELLDVSANFTSRISQAEDYFNAAERDREALRFNDAAMNYEKSVRCYPTISGYLNLGNSWLMAASFNFAEEALKEGLALSKKKGKKILEAAILNNLGIVHSFQKRFEDSLLVLRDALKIYQGEGDLLGKANVLSNLGSIYLEKGEKKSAYEALGQATVIYENALNKGKEIEIFKSIVDYLKAKTGEPPKLTQHNNVPGAVNRRRELIAEKRHYFTFSRELANVLVKQDGCTIILKMDCMKDRDEWQYLFYLRSSDNEIVVAKAPSNDISHPNRIYFLVRVSGVIQLDAFTESAPETDKEIYLLVGKAGNKSWKGLWSYVKPVEFSEIPNDKKVMGSGTDVFQQFFNQDGFIGSLEGTRYFPSVKVVYFVLSKTWLLSNTEKELPGGGE